MTFLTSKGKIFRRVLKENEQQSCWEKGPKMSAWVGRRLKWADKDSGIFSLVCKYKDKNDYLLENCIWECIFN